MGADNKKLLTTLAVVAGIGGAFYLIKKGGKLVQGSKLNFALLGFQLHKLDLKELQFTVKLRCYNPTKETASLALHQAVAHYKNAPIAYSKPDIQGVKIDAGTSKDMSIRFQVPYLNLVGKGLSIPLLQDSSALSRHLSFTLTLSVNGETLTTTQNLSKDMQGITLNQNKVFGSKGSSSRLAQSEKSEFTPVNDYFSDKRNAEIGHLGQTLGIVSGPRNTQDGRKYNHLIKKAEGKDVYIKDGDVTATVEACIELVAEHYREVEALAKSLQANNLKETCRNIFNFSYNYLQYKLDKQGTEQLRTPARSWLDGQIRFKQQGDKSKGIDCDDYSIFVGSLLKCLGIPFKFRITKYDGKSYFQHIYVIVPSEGDSEDEIVIDPVLSKFDYQKPYSFEVSNFNMSPIQLAGSISGIDGFLGTTSLGLPISVLSGIGNTQAQKDEYTELMGIVSGVDFEQTVNGLGDPEDATYRYLVRTRDFLVRSKSNAQKMSHIQNPDQFIKMLEEAIKHWHSDKRYTVLDKLADIEEKLAQSGFIKYDTEALQGLEELEELEDALDGLGLSGDELGLFRKRKKRKRGGFFRSIKRVGKKVKSKVKRLGKKVKKVGKKVIKAIVRFNPLTIAMRGGLLAAMHLNMFGIAKKLQYAYLPDNLASKHGVDVEKLAKLKKTHRKVKKLFTGLQGKENNLRKAILKGAKQKSSDFSLKGIEGIVSGLQGLENNGELQELGELGAVATGASVAAASGLLAKIGAWLKPVKNIFSKAKGAIAKRQVKRLERKGKPVSKALQERAYKVTAPVKLNIPQAAPISYPRIPQAVSPPYVSEDDYAMLPTQETMPIPSNPIPSNPNYSPTNMTNYNNELSPRAIKGSVKKGLSKRAKVGIGIGVVALVGTGIYFAVKSRDKPKTRAKPKSTTNKKQLGAIKFQ